MNFIKRNCKTKPRFIISAISLLLVTVSAAIAFTLSFNALRAVASENGIPAHLAWLFPLAVDGFILTAGLSSLRASLYGEKTLYPVALLVLFTSVSIALNVTHGGGAWEIKPAYLSTIVAFVPPAALCLSTELWLSQVRGELSDKDSAPTSQRVAEVEQERDELRAELAQVATLSPLLNKLPMQTRAELYTIADGNGVKPREIAEVLRISLASAQHGVRAANDGE